MFQFILRTDRLSIFFVLLGLFTAGFSNAQIAFTGSKITGADASKMLEHHNQVRSEVGVGKMEWDAGLAAYAQRWADHLAKNNQCRMKHRSGSNREGANYGENIFWGSSAEAFTPLDASESWYSEKAKYRYGRLNEDNWYPSGHYTQMIWRKTVSMGAGMSVCPDGALIVVANYDPPGNYMGEYPY